MRTKSGLYFPKKGSAEAKAWGRRMAALRKKKGVRWKSKRNPGARWHLQHAHLSRDMEDASRGVVRKSYYRGQGRAHITSAAAAKRMGMNPRKLRYKNLNLHEHFIFSGERQWLGMAQGPWVKLGTRKYQHINGGPIHRVGSINAEVERIPTNPRLRTIDPRKVCGKSVRQVRPHRTFRRCVSKVTRRVRRAGLKVKKNPLVIANPLRGAKLLYHGNVEIRGRRAVGRYRGSLFKHPFSARAQVDVLGLKDGTVLLRSRTGAPLWGYVQ